MRKEERRARLNTTTATKKMSQVDPDSLSEREKWILRLLYAPFNEEEQSQGIEGKTRLMKGLFLLDRKLSEKFCEDTDFSFKPYKYGPFDRAVYDCLDHLKYSGLVEIVPTSRYEGNKIQLTATGEELAKEAFNELSEGERDLVFWIKGKHVQKPLSQLLSFVYNQYPEQATNSELDIP